MRAVDLAWLAGILDGEGTITLCGNRRKRSYYIQVSIGMTHLPTIQHIRRTTAVGFFVRSVPKNPKHRTCYYWTARCKNAAMWLRKLLPYLVTKKRQAKIALEYDSLMMPIGKRIPNINRQKREALIRRWRALNKKGVLQK